MVHVEKHNRVEDVDRAMPTKHWMRTRKPTVDYLRDAPFALDRQLEDQRLSQLTNRNPQLHQPTKVDKTRSQLILAPKGASRAVAMKANALNKFVREASGIHNYTIVAPPRAICNDLGVTEVLDPETNPRVRSYAAEAKLKPVLCSFGHRPSSASRTFHPASMKFRLPHGGIVPKMDARRSSVGLPVAVLKKVIHAPPIVNFIEEIKRASQPTSPVDSPFASKPGSPLLSTGGPKYSDLFLSKAEQDSLFSKGDMSSRSHGSSKRRLQPLQGRSQATWVSSEVDPLLKVPDDRPTWDEGFHRIAQPASHLFQLRASGLTSKEKKPLGELLHRFSSLSVAENQFHPFCTERQQMDKEARTGVQPEVPRSTAVKGQKLYFDPLDMEVAEVKRHRRVGERKKERREKLWDYKEVVRAIEDVDYYPTSKLTQEMLDKHPEMANMEAEMKASLAEARKGNMSALYAENFRKHDPDGRYRIKGLEEQFHDDL